MGRVKLKIKKLESTSNRQVTYSKRKNGILKKAKELSILCDIDIVLLMFSPTGRATLLQGERSNIEEIIVKFAQLIPQERTKRKLESLEALKKIFQKLDHDVKIQDFLGSSSQVVQDFAEQVRALRAQLAETHRRLSYWSNPEKMDNIEPLRQMEELLKESISRVCLQKENVGKYQLTSLEFSSRLQDGMPSPYMMGGLQEAQTLSWFLNNENQHLILPDESKILPFGNAPHKDTECTNDVLLPSYSDPFGRGKQLEVGNSEAANMSQGGDAMNVLSGNGCLNVELHDQYAYPLYGNQTMPANEKLRPEMKTSIQPYPLDYPVNGSSNLPVPMREGGYPSWSSTTDLCDIALHNVNGYHQ